MWRSLPDLTDSYLHKYIQQTPPTMTTNLLSDSKQFIHTFFDVIGAFPLQVYHSALLFTPTDTKLWNMYCSISFNLYGHASHCQKPTKIFVSHPVKEAILGLAELAELSRASRA
jgi:hypothetical protein